MNSDIKIQPLKFMFMDYWPYEKIVDLSRVTPGTVRYTGNPILRAEMPHELDRIHLYGTVLRDPSDGLIKMWYSCHGNECKVSRMALAVSQDGYNFKRPDFDVLPGTNAVMDTDMYVHGPSLIYDEYECDDRRRFKLLMRPYDGKGHINGYISANGINWESLPENPLMPIDSDSHIGLCFNPHIGCYQATIRANCIDRRVWTIVSRDFIHWDAPRLVLEPRIDEDVQTQFYSMQISTYGPYIMGWISMFYTNGDDMRFEKMDGSMDVQTAFSRDGFFYHRVDMDNHLIRAGGNKGTFDSIQIRPSSAPVLFDDKILFYYVGHCKQHDSPPPHTEAGIGVAELRPDGFAGLRAGETTGVIVTRPFSVDLPGIILNADMPLGECRLSVCLEDGSVIDGFSRENCIPMTEDSIRHRVRFMGNPDEKSYANIPIRLKIYLKRGILYSVTMANGHKEPDYWDFREIKCLKPDLDIQTKSKRVLNK